MTTTFKANPHLGAELGADLRRRRAMVPAAQAVARHAEGMTHSAMPRKGQPRKIRVGEINGEVVVANTNHGAHLEEFGQAKTPVYAPLRRGVRAAGLKLRES